MLTATCLINRTPMVTHNNKTPFELLFKKVHSYGHIRSFGCLCFASNLTTHKTKFTSRARKCIFISNVANTKGYILYDLDTHTFLVSRDVVFHENIFLFQKSQIKVPTNHIDMPNLVLPVVPSINVVFQNSFPDNQISNPSNNIGVNESHLGHMENLMQSESGNTILVQIVNPLQSETTVCAWFCQKKF